MKFYMNFILNENDLNLNNIEINYKNDSIKINYLMNSIKSNGIPLIITDGFKFKIIKNYIYVYFKNDHPLLNQLKKINDHFYKEIPNYKSFIKNNMIKIKYVHKNIINNTIKFSLSNLKFKYDFFFLNIFQI